MADEKELRKQEAEESVNCKKSRGRGYNKSKAKQTRNTSKSRESGRTTASRKRARWQRLGRV